MVFNHIYIYYEMRVCREAHPHIYLHVKRYPSGCSPAVRSSLCPHGIVQEVVVGLDQLLVIVELQCLTISLHSVSVFIVSTVFPYWILRPASPAGMHVHDPLGCPDYKIKRISQDIPRLWDVSLSFVILASGKVVPRAVCLMALSVSGWL